MKNISKKTIVGSIRECTTQPGLDAVFVLFGIKSLSEKTLLLEKAMEPAIFSATISKDPKAIYETICTVFLQGEWRLYLEHVKAKKSWEMLLAAFRTCQSPEAVEKLFNLLEIKRLKTRTVLLEEVMGIRAEIESEPFTDEEAYDSAKNIFGDRLWVANIKAREQK